MPRSTPVFSPLPGRDKIPDREQVRGFVRWLQRQQQEGELVNLLDRPWGDEPKLHRRVTEHEGWVRGL